MRGPVQGIQNKVIQYSAKGGEPAVASAQPGQQLNLFNATAINYSGGVADVGVMKVLNPAVAKVYKLVSGVYTPLSLEDLASGLEVNAGGAGDGFAVGYAGECLGFANLNISTAAAGGDFTCQYSNDGSTFIDIPTGSSLEKPTDWSSAGANYAVLQSPQDAVAGGPAPLDPSFTYLQFISSGALAGPVEIDGLVLGAFMTLWNDVADKSGISVSFDWGRPLPLGGGENVGAYFSAASTANRFSTFYNVNG